MDVARGVHDANGQVAKQSRSAPAAQQFQSPLRQHRRTPSQHREVKVRMAKCVYVPRGRKADNVAGNIECQIRIH